MSNLKTKISVPLKNKRAVKIVSPNPSIKRNPPVGIRRVFFDQQDLSANYDVTKLTLIARDPFGIYAYWEISAQSADEIKKKIGSDFARSVYILRMHEMGRINLNGANGNHSFDVEVGQVNDRHVNVVKDRVSYYAEIGLRTPVGKFFSLTRSNIVTTPPAAASGRTDMIWMEVEDQSIPRSFVFLEGQKRNVKIPTKKSRRKIFLTEDDIRAYYASRFPLLRRLRASGLKARELKGSYGGEGRLENIFTHGWVKGKRGMKMLLGASDKFAWEGASESLGGASSARENLSRKFFFEIGTELIVYGRTEADAKVRLGGKEINLRSDGTFSLRFALPDGKIPLDFLAQSKNKVDQRSISTSVERAKTIYQ